MKRVAIKALLMALFSIIILELSLNVSAIHKGKRDIHHECREFGFNLSIIEWRMRSKVWVPMGNDMGTMITGDNKIANWDVGTLDEIGDTGIVVKSGKSQFSINGTNGTVTANKTINRIIFCLKFHPCIPPPDGCPPICP